MPKQAHIMIGDQPFCTWTGCKAGQDIAAKAGVRFCGQVSIAAAKRNAKLLAPHFKVKVQAVAGPCPAGPA